jgi:uncharacterized protein (TIGR03032 family)
MQHILKDGSTIVFSGGFASCLEGIDASIALTGYQTGQLLLLGSQANEVIVDESNFDYIMGVHVVNDRFFVSTRSQILQFENIGIQNDSDLVHDAFFVPRRAHTVGDIDVHEMGIVHTGELLFINTLFSCLAVTDAIHGFKPVWKPPWISELKPEFRCHINGLCIYDNIPRFITAISNSNEPDGWRGKRQNTGVLVDIFSNEIVLDGLSMPHSPRIHNDRLWFLESGKGNLVSCNLDGSNRENIGSFPGFLRGLKLVGDYAIACTSLGRDDGFVGLELDKAFNGTGITPWCGVHVINIKTGEMIAWAKCEGPLREFFGVDILSGIRTPRSIDLHDETSPLLATSSGANVPLTNWTQHVLADGHAGLIPVRTSNQSITHILNRM